jgi:gamma-glutamylcyclotransferase (GGCT)/AIG2-like uncharacterized protein YtfP
LTEIHPPRLFVYGTLQPGRLRWPYLEPFSLGHRPAAVGGRLYDSGKGWPAAVFAGPDDEPIPGTLVDLDPAQAVEALRVLDEVEGSVEGLFRRVAVVTGDGERAWSYEWARQTRDMVRINRWHARNEA